MLTCLPFVNCVSAYKFDESKASVHSIVVHYIDEANIADSKWSWPQAPVRKVRRASLRCLSSSPWSRRWCVRPTCSELCETLTSPGMCLVKSKFLLLIWAKLKNEHHFSSRYHCFIFWTKKTLWWKLIVNSFMITYVFVASYLDFLGLISSQKTWCPFVLLATV